MSFTLPSSWLFFAAILLLSLFGIDIYLERRTKQTLLTAITRAFLYYWERNRGATLLFLLPAVVLLLGVALQVAFTNRLVLFILSVFLIWGAIATLYIFFTSGVIEKVKKSRGFRNFLLLVGALLMLIYFITIPVAVVYLVNWATDSLRAVMALSQKERELISVIISGTIICASLIVILRQLHYRLTDNGRGTGNLIAAEDLGFIKKIKDRQDGQLLTGDYS